MTCGEPAMVSAAVPHVATPLTLTATLLQLAIVVPSALNVTLPSLLGLPEPAPVLFNDAATAEICPLSLHDALPISAVDVVRLLTVCPPVRVPVLLAKLAPLA